MDRTCNKCLTTKPIEEFPWKQKSKGTRQYHCQECARAHSREWYNKNKQAHVANVRTYNKKSVDAYKEYISSLNLKCAHCGETHEAVLDFHHVDPGTKEYTVSYLSGKGFSLDKIKKEIDKCIVLCSNCHRKLHWAERQ